MIIKKRTEIVDYDNLTMYRFIKKHYDLYVAARYKYNDISENFDIFDMEVKLTASEVKEIAKANKITWEE